MLIMSEASAALQHYGDSAMYCVPALATDSWGEGKESGKEGRPKKIHHNTMSKAGTILISLLVDQRSSSLILSYLSARM
jgi:hypothetical protein